MNQSRRPDDESPSARADALHAVDRATSFVERPVRQLSGRFNPLPHAGTISVFLLGIVIVTGLYITLFFSFGHAASYDAVAAMEGHAIQRVMRALHRYSSAALVLTTVVHAWRIFASGRFTARRRRWRWLTGVASLALVWLAGVSGYWLIWDRRAAAINEVTAQLVRPLPVGDRFVVRNLLGVSPGSGSGFLLFLWFVHVLVSVAIVWFIYRHLRHSKQPWLPPRHWMALMGGGLFLVSIVVPVGMLGPARPDQLVSDMPLDPFVMFLLPPLLAEWRWVAVAVIGVLGAGATLLPFAVKRKDPLPIVIDEAACTGCEICVDDCPYDALYMVNTEGRALALLDDSRCVSCGICVGSCAFDAIDLPGWKAPTDDVEGKSVLVICNRHSPPDGVADGRVVVPVTCSGVFAPSVVKGYIERGATGVELVGCAPYDCRFGIGNKLADERLAGTRAPHPPRKLAGRITASWVTPDGAWSKADPAKDYDDTPASSQLLTPGVVVFLSILAIVAATRAPFRTDSDRSELRLVADHAQDGTLAGIDQTTGVITSAELSVDGALVSTVPMNHSGSSTIDFVDWDLAPGAHEVSVAAVADGQPATVFSGTVQAVPGERIVITAFDVPPPPGSEEGRDVFTSRAAGCDVCHSTDMGEDGVGPSLGGVATIAGSRVQGLDAEQYLRQSILLPDQYIVDGWPAGQMLPIYRERLTATELEALLAYLLTLTEDGQ